MQQVVQGFLHMDDGTVYASGTTVKTTQDTSGGVHVAGGGTLYGWDSGCRDKR